MRFRCLVWPGLVWAYLACACGGLPPEVKRARDLLERGWYRDAERAADRALDGYPGHPVLWRVKIQAAMGQRDAQRAVALYKEWHTTRQPGPDSHDRVVLRRMALSTLWQGLRVPSGRVQARTIQAIERLEIEKLARDVADRITDDDDVVAAAAAVALLRSDFNAPRVATQLLSSEVAEARAIVIEGIGRKIRSAARGDLLPFLADPSPAARLAAVRAVAAMNDDRDNARFIAMAERDGEGSIRAAALRVLADSTRAWHRSADRATAVAAARRALSDHNSAARLAAVAVLQRHRDIEALRRVMQSNDLPSALRAAAALHRATAGDNRDRDRAGDRGQQAVFALIDRALADLAPAVRVAGIEASVEVMPVTLTKKLSRGRLGDASDRVRLIAARVLLRIGERGGATAALVTALDSAEVDIRVEAATDLARLGHPRGLLALAELCQSADDPAIRELAVRRHGDIDKLTMGLVTALADSSPRVRVVAAETMLRVAD